MSDAGTQRRARVAPERQLSEGEVPGEQLDLLEEEKTLTPEEQADEHKKQIEELNRQRTVDQQKLAEAERLAREQATQLESAQKNALSAQEQAILNGITSQQGLVEQAKLSLRAARESGDFDAEEKALEALTDAKAQLVSLNGQKQYLENYKKQVPVRQQVQQQVQQDTYRGAHGYSKPSEDWLTQHPRFDSEPYYKTVVLQAANAAMQSGHPADSPGFFQFMDDVMSKAFPTQQQQQQQSFARRGPAASSVAAGPSRASTQQRNGNGQANINDVARHLGVTAQDIQEYAKINRMKVEDYVAEQAKIMEEEKAGIATGLYRGEGISR